jgi:ATP-dependent 26S proteasome regulatory subunit
MGEPSDQAWAVQRRVEDVLAKLGEKYGDLTGRVEVLVRPSVSFEKIGGLASAKEAVRGLAVALGSPDLYGAWGITPAKGILLYGPPGTGKTLLAKALATQASAIFYHLKLLNITSKFGPSTGELLQEIFDLLPAEGKAVVFLDEADALSLEHLMPPPQAREVSARLVAALVEKLDGMNPSARRLVIGATSRADALDPSLVAPGRLDRIIEVPLPDSAAQQEIVEICRTKAEGTAKRSLFAPLDYQLLLPPMIGMSGAEIAEIIRRALETKVHQVGLGQSPGVVTTQDLLQEVDRYRRVREIVEKIRYGQYL